MDNRDSESLSKIARYLDNIGGVLLIIMLAQIMSCVGSFNGAP